jgi:CDP-diacylglycerol--serine O-phosphatidyltransferase
MKGSSVRAAFTKERSKRTAIYLIPNLLTTGNLFCGLFSVLAVFNGNYLAAAISILVALIFDMLDGKSARWMKSTSQFGVEYDSLADVVAFGVAPGILIYAWALHAKGMFGAAVMFAFVACGALRLARFNVMSSSSETRYFTGLPIPAAASVVASLVVFDHYVYQFDETVRPLLVLILTLCLAFLMVSTVKFRSFKDLKFKDGNHFNYLVWAILGLMMVIAWPQLMLFVVAGGYALSGPLANLGSLVAKMLGRRGPATMSDATPSERGE